jgi:pyruvate dehydrogenase E1 component
MIQRWVGGNYVVLGTDGFGRSDDRAQLRRFFEIDTESIVLATISALEREGRVNTGLTEEVANKLGISRERNDKTS